MAFTDVVSLYTQALNTSFIQAYHAIADPAPIEAALTIVPSHGRVENYPWMYPPPLMHLWQGFRQYAKLGTTNYRVPNLTWTAEFEALLEDLEDDQVDGFKLQAAALAQGAKQWRNIQSQINLSNGQTLGCFDGTNFFATSHTIGTGNNIVPGTATTIDNVTHAAVVLIHKNPLVKPLLWQDRQEPDFRTDAGDNASAKTRMVKWWTDMRGAPAFGFWWDACLIKWTSTPSVTDMQTTIGNVNSRFRGFTYPINLPSDPLQYIHGQLQFSDTTTLMICSTGIEHIARQALTLSLIAQTENYYKGWCSLTASGYMNGVV